MQSQRDFFYAVLSQSGLPCISWLDPSDAKKFHNKTFDTLHDFCEYASTVDYTKANYYFAISTFKEHSVQHNGKRTTRTQTNAAFSRVLVLDIDYKDGHFKDNETALAAVNNISDTFGFARPIAVASGYGLHVYWPFAEGIPSADWKKIADKFKAFMQLTAPSLVSDGSRVADSAGVLRIPDSFNLKKGGQVPVEIIQWSDATTDLGRIKSVIGYDVNTNGKVSLAVVREELPPAELTKVAKNCNWFATYLKNRKDASEPEWYATLGLVPYLKHKDLPQEQIAQLISQGHPDYDEAATEIKYNQAKNSATGPSTCERFRGISNSRCVGCPFATSVKTPIQAAYLAKAATEEAVVETKVTDDVGNTKVETVVIPLPPSPYFRGENGGVFLRVKEKQDDGTWVEHIEMIYDYDIYPVKRYRTELTENELMEIHVWLPHDGLRVFKMPTSVLAEQKKLATYLAEKGVIPRHGKMPYLTKYMVDYIRYLQTIGAAEVEFSRFGWRDLRSANPKFVVGNGYIDKTGTLQPASFAYFLKDAAKSAATAGTLEGWKAGFAGYQGVLDSEPHLLAAMIGFAAPLMAFTEYAGVLYNMVGESAAGKSTALKFMTSIFGQPNPEHVLVKDTEIAIFNFIGYLNSIPVAMDELTNMEPDKLSNFALGFTGGRGKMRATREGQNKSQEVEWDTIVVGSSNTSMYDKLASHRKGYTAEAMRILEVKLNDSHPQFKGQIDRSIDLLKRNYGHAGRVYVSYLIQNVALIDKLLVETIKKISVEGGYRNEERFWAALWACVYVGGMISKKLGLHNYDVKRLVDWGTGQIAGIREAVKISTSDPISILADFLNSNLDAVIRFKDDKPYLGPDGRALQNIRSVKVRIELDDVNVAYKAWISTPSVRAYCEQRRVDPSWLTKALVDMGVIIAMNKSKRLATGSGIDSVPVKCWEINMKHQRIINAVEVVEPPPTADPPQQV